MRKFTPVHTLGDLAFRVVRVLVVGLVIGVAASLAALALVELVELGTRWLGNLRNRSSTTTAIALTVLVPALGGLLVGLIVRHMSGQRPHNPADVILAAQSGMKLTRLGVRDGILNYIASLISLACGASVGQYGPIVNMGATLAANLRRFSGTDSTVLIGCGVAAAISAAFDAPIAGIIFAHEVILRHYSLRAFAPITIAAAAAFYNSKFVFDLTPLFQIEFMQIEYIGEFVMFTLTGILGGLLAVIFLRAILYARLGASRLPVSAPLRPMLAGLLIGLMALEVPEILGIGDQVMRQTLYAQNLSALHVTELLVAKLAASAVCLGFGFAGGVFGPSLLIGVLFGSLFGIGIDQLVPHSNIAVYAVCGMAAVTSPVIGAPLTTILIVFELTRSYELTTAVMISVVFSNIISYRLFGRSLFDFQLKSRGFDLSLGRDPLVLRTQRIASIVRPEFCQLGQQSTIAEAIDHLRRDGRGVAYLVDDQQRFVGSLTLADLLSQPQTAQSIQATVDLVNANCLRFSPDTSLWFAAGAVKGFVGESIPVVDPENDRLTGVIHEADLITAYTQTARELRSEETANA